MSENRRPRSFRLSSNEEPFRRNLRLPMFVFSLFVSSGAMSTNSVSCSCPYLVRVHTASGPSPDAMGLSFGFRCTLERTVCYRTVAAHARRCHEFP